MLVADNRLSAASPPGGILPSVGEAIHGRLPGEVVVARRVNRTGVTQLSRVGDQYYVGLKNSTYYSKYAIEPEAVERWKQHFGVKDE